MSRYINGVKSETGDYFGHTHQPEIRKEGQTLIINPGECGGWLYGKSTVAICDLKSQTAEMVEL